MKSFSTLEDKEFLENEMQFDNRFSEKTMYSFLSRSADKFPERPALSFQLKSGKNDPAETLSWSKLKELITKSANYFRSLDLKESDVIAYILPNCNEAVITFLAGTCSSAVCPINPLLDPDQISSILNEVNAKVVVTLAPFPKTDVAEKVNVALSKAPNVTTLLEVDLKKYLSPPISWLIPLLRLFVKPIFLSFLIRIK